MCEWWGTKCTPIIFVRFPAKYTSFVLIIRDFRLSCQLQIEIHDFVQFSSNEVHSNGTSLRGHNWMLLAHWS